MGKRIFIADDDEAILDVVSIILEDAGYEVETSASGETLMQSDGIVPDLYLIDIWMLGKDGRDICKYLKANERTKHVPILVVSANREIEKITQSVGADAFIAKPFEMNDLLSTIAKYVN